MSISDQFSGLPLDSLIGGPLKAAAKAQAESAKATADFMKAVDAPLLTLTPIPALILDETTVDFAMEVNEKMPPED